MRQEHPAGDKVFVDYSGKRIGIVVREAASLDDAEWLALLLEQKATLRRQKKFDSRAWPLER